MLRVVRQRQAAALGWVALDVYHIHHGYSRSTYRTISSKCYSALRELQLGVACAAPACDYAANHCMGVCTACHQQPMCVSRLLPQFSWNTDSVTPCLLRPPTGLCYRVGDDTTLRGAARCCVGWVVFTGVSMQDGHQQLTRPSPAAAAVEPQSCGRLVTPLNSAAAHCCTCHSALEIRRGVACAE
jgi:hypothetical protein